MPPKALKGVVADRTDPATLRPDLTPEAQTGTKFIPMKYPAFDAQIVTAVVTEVVGVKVSQLGLACCLGFPLIITLNCT